MKCVFAFTTSLYTNFFSFYSRNTPIFCTLKGRNLKVNKWTTFNDPQLLPCTCHARDFCGKDRSLWCALKSLYNIGELGTKIIIIILCLWYILIYLNKKFDLLQLLVCGTACSCYAV